MRWGGGGAFHAPCLAAEPVRSGAVRSSPTPRRSRAGRRSILGEAGARRLRTGGWDWTVREATTPSRVCYKEGSVSCVRKWTPSREKSAHARDVQTEKACA